MTVILMNRGRRPITIRMKQKNQLGKLKEVEHIKNHLWENRVVPKHMLRE